MNFHLCCLVKAVKTAPKIKIIGNNRGILNGMPREMQKCIEKKTQKVGNYKMFSS